MVNFCKTLSFRPFLAILPRTFFIFRGANYWFFFLKIHVISYPKMYISQNQNFFEIGRPRASLTLYCMTPFKIILKICQLVCMRILVKNVHSKKKKVQKSQYLRSSTICNLQVTNRLQEEYWWQYDIYIFSN